MKTYPDKLAVSRPNRTTVEMIAKTGARNVAELGVYQGHTTLEIARLLPADGSLDLFDFADNVKRVAQAVKKVRPGIVVRTHGNSQKWRDSYCWSLRALLRAHPEPIWDYVYIDGAHTWDVDGFAFLLCDKLLRVGGYVDFDDYYWTLERGTPGQLSFTQRCYTAEQMKSKQVAEIVDVLVPRLGYEGVIARKVYRKCRA